MSGRLAEQAPLKFIAFGPSSTQGAGASSPDVSYPSRLEVELSSRVHRAKVLVLDRGIGEEDAEDMTRRLPAILAERPVLVIWQTGSNDPLRDVPIEHFESQSRDEIVAIRRPGST